MFGGQPVGDIGIDNFVQRRTQRLLGVAVPIPARKIARFDREQIDLLRAAIQTADRRHVNPVLPRSPRRPGVNVKPKLAEKIGQNRVKFAAFF